MIGCSTFLQKLFVSALICIFVATSSVAAAFGGKLEVVDGKNVYQLGDIIPITLSLDEVARDGLAVLSGVLMYDPSQLRPVGFDDSDSAVHSWVTESTYISEGYISLEGFVSTVVQELRPLRAPLATVDFEVIDAGDTSITALLGVMYDNQIARDYIEESVQTLHFTVPGKTLGGQASEVDEDVITRALIREHSERGFIAYRDLSIPGFRNQTNLSVTSNNQDVDVNQVIPEQRGTFWYVLLSIIAVLSVVLVLQLLQMRNVRIMLREAVEHKNT